MSISASDVMKLRKLTGAGMMECKKALVEAEGDSEKAVEIIAKSGQRKLAKTAGRIAAEGMVFVSGNDTKIAVIEINCETDFVARDENFSNFGEELAGLVLTTGIVDMEALANEKMASGESVQDARTALVGKIGENISLRRATVVTAGAGEVISYYKHGGKIAAIARLNGKATAELARDIALHIAGMNPSYVSLESIPAETLNKEREIFTAQANDSGKPQEIIEKMVEGKINKHFSAMCLVLQDFVKDADKTVKQLLSEHSAEVLDFVRFEVGEGIEKKEVNFAEEVAAQAKGA